MTFVTLDIRNYSQLNGLNVPDASMLPVTCTSDVLELIKIGQKNRAVGATALNERSSRSHRYAKCWICFKYLYFLEHDPLVGSTSHGCVKNLHIDIVGVVDHDCVYIWIMLCTMTP
mgnify:CR=1 FL=1